MRRTAILLFTCLILVIGCGESDDDTTLIGAGEETAGEANDSVSPGEPAEETPAPPVTTVTQYFGQGGNLWKPRGDDHGGSPGNLVVLFSSQFTEQFDNCEVKLRDGAPVQLVCINDQPWTQTPYSCFTNGDRQTWRANFGCGSAAEVKVTCRRPLQEVIFTVPDAQRGQVCTRHG